MTTALDREEHARQVRLKRYFDALGKTGADPQLVLQDLLSIEGEDLLRNQKAMRLMSEWLSEEEMKTFMDTGEIRIQSKLDKDKFYVITRGRHDLTQVYEKGKHTKDLCVHAENVYELPYGDAILTKIIALKQNEMAYIASSNARNVTTERREVQGGWANAYGSDPRTMLFTAVQRLNDATIGVVSTSPKYPGVSTEIYRSCIKFSAAQALIDGISSVPEGLAVRGLMPDRDLRFVNFAGGEESCIPSWRQPMDGAWRAEQCGGREIEVYRTNFNSGNDRKTICIYGIANLLPESRSCVSQVLFMRGSYKIIDRIDTQNLNQVECITFNTPILFKKNDDMKIKFVLTDDAECKISRIMFLGTVAEPLGHEIVG